MINRLDYSCSSSDVLRTEYDRLTNAMKYAKNNYEKNILWVERFAITLEMGMTTCSFPRDPETGDVTDG